MNEKLKQLQARLFDIGAYGKNATRAAEVDGKMGRRTRDAVTKALKMGYYVDLNKGTVTNVRIGGSQSSSNFGPTYGQISNDPTNVPGYNPVFGGKLAPGQGYGLPEVTVTANPRGYSARAQQTRTTVNGRTVSEARQQREEQARANNPRPVTTGGAGYIPPAPQQSSKSSSSTKKEESNTPTTTSGTEHAIYLHYPNFVGKSANALKVGGVDVGAAIGNPDVPVGHSAFILVGPDGASNYYEYGRYTSGFGHVRPTVKGGNWRRISLPSYGSSDNDSTYVARVQGLLPDTKTGAYQAITIPDVDTQRATEWIYGQANDPNRDEYSITNTCATGACSATLPFRRSSQFNPENIFNWGGYSPAARAWTFVPGGTDSYARAARAAGSDVYIMNQ